MSVRTVRLRSHYPYTRGTRALFPSSGPRLVSRVFTSVYRIISDMVRRYSDISGGTTGEWFVHLPEVVFVLDFSSVEHGGSTKGFKETKEERSE